MAEAGSFAERVKQQADIVRVIGEYVRLKKSGQNFTGLCPFHQEKTPSFAVHPVKQIYHCFGCGAGGDVFKFVMEMDKCAFPEAVRAVAEKCGIPLPKPRERSPEERRENQQRAALVEMQREAAMFFGRALKNSDEGKAAQAYLEERGLDSEAIARFGLGYAPSSGDALLRHFKPKYAEKLLEASGLFSRDQNGRLFDRFRRRVMFPIANESGKIIAFGGRSLGDDMPKYLNSPETPIYSKSSVLYHLDRAKEAIRKSDFAVLVEGYMDTIAVARAGIANVVASCGTSLADGQIKLLGRFSRHVVVNYDPDTAGVAATERSLVLLLEKEFDVRVLALPDGADPDKYIREHGAEDYGKRLREAPAYLDYLIARARQMDRTTPEGKLAAVNFLMPYAQRIPNALLRSELASKIAAELRIEEPVLREAMRRAVAERRSEVKQDPSLLTPSVRQAERRLMQMLIESDNLREHVALRMAEAEHHKGLETEHIFEVLIESVRSGASVDPIELAQSLADYERALLFQALFEMEREQFSQELAESCLVELTCRKLEMRVAELRRKIASLAPKQMDASLQREFSNLSRELARLRGLKVLSGEAEN